MKQMRRDRSVKAHAWKKEPLQPEGRLERFDQWVEKNPFFRLCGLLGALVAFVVVVGTGWQILSEAEDREQEREFRRNAQVAQAYEILHRPVGGNTGKGEALTFLFNHGAVPNGTDISCEMSVNQALAAECKNPPILTGLVLDGQERRRLRKAAGHRADDKPWTYYTPLRAKGVILRDLNWNNVQIIDPVFQDVHFDNLQVRDTYITWLHAKRVSFQPGDWTSFRCTFCSFEDSWINAEHWPRSGNHAYLSGGIVTISASDVSAFAAISGNSGSNGPLHVTIGNLPQIHLIGEAVFQDEGLEYEEIPAPTMDEALTIFNFCKPFNGGVDWKSDDWWEFIDISHRDEKIGEIISSGIAATVCGFRYKEVKALVDAEVQEWYND